jgi:hypothetical protein
MHNLGLKEEIDMEWLVAVMTICAAVVTIVWFVKDIRKENSKVLKAILDAQQGTLGIQKTALEIQKEEAEILSGQSKLLAKTEEGQRKGFETLAQILTKIEEGQRKGFEKLAEIESRGFESLAQILVKVGAR